MRTRVARCAQSWRKHSDFGRQRFDLARANAAQIDLADELPRSGGVGKCDALPDACPEHGRIMFGERGTGFARDDRARSAAVEHEARDDLGPEHTGFAEQSQHLARRPAIERRGRRGHEHDVGGEQRGARDAGDARWPIDDDMVGVAGEHGQLAVQRLARQAKYPE